MPLEISEIGISMRVAPGAAGGESGALQAADPTIGIDREELIAECVRRVVRTLESLRER